MIASSLSTNSILVLISFNILKRPLHSFALQNWPFALHLDVLLPPTSLLVFLDFIINFVSRTTNVGIYIYSPLLEYDHLQRIGRGEVFGDNINIIKFI